MSFSPKYCDSTAVEWFRRAIPQLESNDGLCLAAVAISRHQIHDANPDATRTQADAYAKEIRNRVQSDSATALLANLHQVLFDEEGFRGNGQHYYNERNSYLPSVMHSKKGIPITLTLVYKLVAERLGLRVEGLNCPGHFMARVFCEQDTLIIDPFYGGQMLTEAEAAARIGALLGPSFQASESVFHAATHQEWIARILRNLQAVFSMKNDVNNLRAMQELERLLP